jgi:hyperosmotically inducible periplasmic protein
MRGHAVVVFGMTMICSLVLAAEHGRVGDDEITARVKGALMAENATNAPQIEVETRSGVVQLSGFVESDDVQEDVIRTARNVDGVAEVRNDLTVRASDDFTVQDHDRSAGEVVDDGIIAARVKSKLAADAGLETPGDVNVEVDHGVVQLSGFVTTTDEKNRAADAVSTVAGVKDVRNNIALAPEGIDQER